MVQFWPTMWAQIWFNMSGLWRRRQEDEEQLMTPQFPWFNREQFDWIVNKTSDIKDPIQRNKKQDELYKKAIPVIQQRKKVQEKSNQIRELEYMKNTTKDEEERNILNVQTKVLEISNLLRENAPWDISLDDDELVEKYVNAIPEWRWEQLFIDYINGDSDELLTVTGLKEETMAMDDVKGKNPLLRAWAWLAKWVAWAVKWAYEWLVPWFWEMIEDSKRIINDPNKWFAEKFNQILFWEIWADYIWGAIWDTFGGALEWLYEWFTTSTEREFVNDKVKWIMEWIVSKEPAQNIMQKYNELEPQEQEELNDLMWYGMNALEFAGIWLAGKPAKEITAKWLKVGSEILDQTLWEATEQVGKWLTKVKEFSPVEETAKVLTKTSSPHDKLFKAQNPSLNVLNKNRDFKAIRKQSDLANQLVVDALHIPVDTETRRIAHYATMKSKWGEIEARIQNKEDLMVDQTQFADVIDDIVKDAKNSGIVKNQPDIKALEAEAKAMRKQGMIDLPTLEKKKQFINGIINNWWDSQVWDVYKNGMKQVTRVIGEVEDATLAKIPWEFSNLKKEFWALKSTYEDILKADLKNQKAKWLNIMESYSRIEGIGDIIWGTISIFTRWSDSLKDIAKGAGKVFLWKSLKKASDLDFLVKEWFKDLSSKLKVND